MRDRLPSRTFFLSVFLVLTVALNAMAGPGLAASMTVDSPDDLAYSSNDKIPNFAIRDSGYTKATHRMKWGTDPADLRTFETDDGDTGTAHYVVNTSGDNPYSLYPDNIDDDSLGVFPRNDNGDPLKANNWTVTGNNASAISVTNVEVNTGVEAVRINSGSSFESGTGSTATVSFHNFSITSDEKKRVASFIAEVNTLESSAVGMINVTDEDGDHYTFFMDSSKNEGHYDVLADSTGEKVVQDKLNNMTLRTTASSDGTFNNIQYVNVTIEDGDIDASFTGIDVGHKSPWTFGEKKKDTDSDDSLEEVTITEPKGQYSVYSLSTLGSSFDDAAIRDLSYPVHWTAAKAPDDRFNLTVEDSDHPTWDKEATLTVRLEAFDKIDHSHGGLDLVGDVEYSSDRYITTQVAEGVSENTALGDASYSGFENSFSSQGDTNVVIDSTVSSGTVYEIQVTVYLTNGEWKDWQQEDTSKKGGGDGSKEPAGFWEKWILNPISGAIAGVLALIGMGKSAGG